MKQKLILAASVAIVAAAAFCGISSAVRISSNNSLFLANAEALMTSETQNYAICYSESVVRIGHTYYDCGSCQKIYDEKGRGSYSKCFR